MNETIKLYDLNADDFTKRRQTQEFSYFQDKFLSFLSPGSEVLDFGSGSGRDLKYFREQGFRAQGLDGSERLAKIAEDYSGCPVTVCDFLSFTPDKKYDGIWACASLLHLKEEEIPVVIGNLRDSLKESGVLYFSVKKGAFKGIRDGRYFTDLTEKELKSLLGKLKGFKTEEYFISQEKRDEKDVSWHNVILRKL